MSRITKAERYVRARIIDGMGMRAAARAAEFAGGTPSPHARALHARVTSLLGRVHPEAADWIRERREEAEVEAAELRALEAACALAAELRKSGGV